MSLLYNAKVLFQNFFGFRKNSTFVTTPHFLYKSKVFQKIQNVAEYILNVFSIQNISADRSDEVRIKSQSN